MSSERFLGGKRKKYRKRTFDWDDCLLDDSDNFDDREFLQCFRVTRESFFEIISGGLKPKDPMMKLYVKLNSFLLHPLRNPWSKNH